MDPLLPRFREAVLLALDDRTSQRHLAEVLARRAAMHARAWPPHPRLDSVREQARAGRENSIRRLTSLVEELQEQARNNGIHVYHAPTSFEAVAHILHVVQRRSPRVITYAQAAVLEEIGLYPALLEAGLPVTEVNMAAHVLRRMDDLPAHPVVPLGHLSPRDLSRIWHEITGQEVRPIPSALVGAMRGHIRPTLRRVDVGIVAATFGIAQTGTLVLADDEGGAAMTAGLARALIVVMSVDRVIATPYDLGALLEVVARGRVGEAAHRQVNLLRTPTDGMAAEDIHLILVDNGRSRWPALGLAEALMCVGCAVCADRGPVIRRVGGQVFNSPYMGPIGAVISPLLWPETHTDMAFTVPPCSECEHACPLDIDLDGLLERVRRVLRERGERLQRKTLWARVGGQLLERVRPRGSDDLDDVFSSFPSPPTLDVEPSGEDLAHADRPASPLDRLIHHLTSRGGDLYRADTAVAARLHLVTTLQHLGVTSVIGWDEEALGVPGLADALAAVGIQYHGPETAFRAGGRLSREWAEATVGVVAARGAIADTGVLLVEGKERRPLAAALVPRSVFIIIPAARVYPSWAEFEHVETVGNALLLGGPTHTFAIAGEEVRPGLGVEAVHIVVVGEEEGGGRWESNPPRPSL